MMSVRRDLPSGTVTFLFTDIESSTTLLHELGAAAYAEALRQHRWVLREAFARHGGVEVDTQGDAFFYVFPIASGALEAAREAQEGLARSPIRVRMGLHTGTAHLTDEGYVGLEVHKGARIAAAGYGGQILLSKETRERVDLNVTDLGEHRLKDFAEPVWIFQLGSQQFPPLKTISNTNLPRPASSFVGREKEIQDVVALLRDRARLLTLIGPGGSGKTRLAIEAAAELVPAFHNGVFWVDLAPLRDPALVAETIGQILGAKDGLAAHIGEREMLLLLDNLEQVIEAAADLASLVERCPSLRLLVTSRELLRVKGEVVYPVPPLAEPEGVALFCDRAQAQPDETIRELCRALDSLPLAIELAAARARVLSPRQILERLSQRLDLLRGGRDADPRQLTLRATIEWSYALLPHNEQVLFARHAIFAGGCTLETAQAVADAGVDALQGLIEKSLLRHVDERFSMLESIREYASEQLRASGEAGERRRRHAEHFLALAEEAAPHLWEGAPGPWLDRLDVEHDNLRVAFDYLEASGETQRVLRLTGALWRFWNLRGHLAEGIRRLERALAADERPTSARARALTGAAAMAARHGDAATARTRAEEALALHRRLGDAFGAALSQSYLATATAEERDWARAREIIEASGQAFRDLGNDYNTMLANWLLAWMCRELGDPARSRALIEENRRWAREAGNQRVEGISLDALAMLAIEERQLADARALLNEALQVHRGYGGRLEVALDLCRFARVLALEGKAVTAARLLSKGDALREETGARFESWAVMEAKANETLAAVRAQLDPATFAEAWRQGRALTVDEAVALALEDSNP